MRAEQYVNEPERSGYSRIVAIVPGTAAPQCRWVAQSQPLHALQRGNVTGAKGGFGLSGRLSLAIGELVEMLVATSGTLVVVVILLVMAMMLRAIRALLRR